ncbi:MAG: tetratricopeptide repeat protein [Acidobacteriota bacterium]|nr:tetratricopeptide repeat protein [Acidobacteriota bacterium]MDQ5871856.1 tetratricopeptide repeat protein [Acidobacteriota bacterium]
MALTLLLSAFATGRAAAHGDLHDQIAEVTRQIARRPDDARLYVKRGELHRFHGEATEALSDYDRAARLDPALAEVDLGRGKTLLEAGRPAQARAALGRFLARRPDHADARLTLARVLVRLRLPREADAEYARAIDLVGRPKPDLYFERSTVLASAGRLDAAIRVIDEGIARLGPLAALEDLGVSIERRRGNYDGALARLDRMTVGKTRREAFLARRGEILADAGRPEEARASLLAARESIESLPTRLRRTRAIARLEREVKSSLDRLETKNRKEKTDAKG